MPIMLKSSSSAPRLRRPAGWLRSRAGGSVGVFDDGFVTPAFASWVGVVAGVVVAAVGELTGV